MATDPRAEAAMLRAQREGNLCSIGIRRKCVLRPTKVFQAATDRTGYVFVVWGWAWLWFVVHYKTERSVVYAD